MGAVYGLDFSPDGETLSSCSRDHTIRMWDLRPFPRMSSARAQRLVGARLDGFETAPLPVHTYDTPGWYLVSCTVTDDEYVTVTDWQYLRVPKGNRDGDADVDLDDYVALLPALTGP